MDITPTEKDLRDLFKVLDADELLCNRLVMSQNDLDMLLGPITIAARGLLYKYTILEEGELFMLDNMTDSEAKIGKILVKISEHPDDELSEQQATMLCQGIAGHLDDTEADIVHAAYTLLARFLPKASKETRDALIPALVVHDL